MMNYVAHAIAAAIMTFIMYLFIQSYDTFWEEMGMWVFLGSYPAYHALHSAIYDYFTDIQFRSWRNLQKRKKRSRKR